MNKPLYFDLYCWLKHYWWRDSAAEWTTSMWAKKWGDPFAAHQNAEISTGRLCEILAEALWDKGFRPTDLFEKKEDE